MLGAGHAPSWGARVGPVRTGVLELTFYPPYLNSAGELGGPDPRPSKDRSSRGARLWGCNGAQQVPRGQGPRAIVIDAGSVSAPWVPPSQSYYPPF